VSAAPEHESAEEIRLLAGIAAGDRESLRQLYARYSRPLFSVAMRMLNDRGAAEERLQDTFLSIWRHAGSYDPRKSQPFTWAFTILRRACIDHLRRQRRTVQSHAMDTEAGPSLADTETESARELAERRETAAQLRSSLAEISSPQREALELALFSSLTHPEIAAQLGQPLGTVKSWIRRGLLDLRTAFNETER
jgi:RNA polymerase sigma-70 factor (ECF subfamily)